MTGYKIKFNGIDRLYDDYSWRLTRRAKKVWASGNMLQGPFLKELETQIAKKYNRQYAIGVGSATDGLYFALKSVGIEQGKTVVCPAFSYVATSGAIRRTGADIQFVDTDQKGNMSQVPMIGLPSAVLYVNMFGNCADYGYLKKYCDKHRIPLIEDAAQSQGATYNKMPSGSLGDVSVFSFDPMKNMPSFGGGGMVLTDDIRIRDSVISLRRHGITGKEKYGYNSLISEDHASQLLLLLTKFNRLQKMRAGVVRRYHKNLPDVEFITATGQNKSSNHKLVMLSDRRDELKAYLEHRGIETKIHYASTLDVANVGDYPNAEKLCSKALSLPIYPHLKNKEIDQICKTIKEFIDV